MQLHVRYSIHHTEDAGESFQRVLAREGERARAHRMLIECIVSLRHGANKISFLLVLLSGSIACVARSSVEKAETRVTTLRVQTSPQDIEYASVWDAVLRYYRKQGVTEADRAGRAHQILGLDSQPLPIRPAPIVLFTQRGASLAPFDAKWLEGVRGRHLVAGTCSASKIISCDDSVATTYLKLMDPTIISRDTIEVQVWEIALNPLFCRSKDGLVDLQEMTIMLIKGVTDWEIRNSTQGWHVTSSCWLVGAGP